MSTRSTISALTNDGKNVRTVYCHFDGYPEYMGNMLLSNYTDNDKVQKLMDLGDLSSVQEHVEPKTDFHCFDNPEDDCCIAYHRDRGEDWDVTKYTEFEYCNDTFVITYRNKVQRYYSDTEFGYYWNGNAWNIYYMNDFVNLEQFMQEQGIEIED